MKAFLPWVLTLSQILLSLQMLAHSQMAHARSEFGTGLTREQLKARVFSRVGQMALPPQGLTQAALQRAIQVRNRMASNRLAQSSARVAGGVTNMVAGAANETAQTLFLIVSLFVAQAVQTRVLQAEYRGQTVSPSELKAFVAEETEVFVQRVETFVSLSGAALFEFPVSMLVDHMTANMDRRIVFQSAVRATTNTLFALGGFAFVDQLVRDAIELEPLAAERPLVDSLDEGGGEPQREASLREISEGFRALSFARDVILNRSKVRPQDLHFVNRLIENMSAILFVSTHRQRLMDNTFRHQFANGDFALMGGVVTASTMGSMIMGKSINLAAKAVTPFLLRTLAGIVSTAVVLSTGSLASGGTAALGAAMLAPAMAPAVTFLVASAIGVSITAAGMLVAIYGVPDTVKDNLHSMLRSLRDSYLEPRASQPALNVLSLQGHLDHLQSLWDDPSIDQELVQRAHERALSRGQKQLAQKLELLEASHFEREKLAGSILTEYARHLDRYRRAHQDARVVRAALEFLTTEDPVDLPAGASRQERRRTFYVRRNQGEWRRKLTEHYNELNEVAERSRSRIAALAREFQEKSAQILDLQKNSFYALLQMRNSRQLDMDGTRLLGFRNQVHVGAVASEYMGAILEVLAEKFEDQSQVNNVVWGIEIVMETSVRGYNERQIARILGGIEVEEVD